jgi:two-component system, cell cycle response regulator DivK
MVIPILELGARGAVLPARPRSGKRDRDQSARPHWPPSTGTHARPAVLVVDDDEDARELYAWCMRAAGWLVEAVPSGEDAIVVAAVLAPDVIVIDLWLPLISGLEAIRRLKSDDNTRHVPIVAISAISRGVAELDARAAGCDEFVAKPFDPATLRELLEAVVERSLGDRA